MITATIRADAAATAAELAPVLAPLAGSTLLVTGAGGFLGSFFLDVFDAYNRDQAARPCHVIGIDNMRVGPPRRIAHHAGNPWIRLITADITRPLPLEAAPDYIIHAASIGSPMIYRPAPLETIAVNVQGTWNVLELARQGCRSVVSMSSSEVYGDPEPDRVPTPEDYVGRVSFTGPRACYDESKRLGETLCASYFRQYGTPVKVARPFNVYGPGQRLDDGRIIPDIMQSALAGGPLVLYSDGRATRSFCYVTDFVHAVLLLLMSKADGEAFNVGNAAEIGIGELARTMAEVASQPPLTVEYRTSPDADFLADNPQRRCPDLGKLEGLTGWRARVGLREGLARTLASYRQEAAEAEDRRAAS